MIQLFGKPRQHQWEAMESLLGYFEEAISISSSVDFRNFLPDQDHPDYSRIASELIRIDLEYCWSRGKYRPMKWYQNLLPKLFEDDEVCQAVSFEIQRLNSTCFNTNNLKQTKSLCSHLESFVKTSFTERLPKPGDSFDLFQIEREISRGSFGYVFLAHQKKMPNSRVVLKITPEPENEWQLIRRLSHPNIIEALSFHESENLRAICMPYLGVSTLADLISEKKLSNNHQKAFSMISYKEISSHRNGNEKISVGELNNIVTKIRQMIKLCHGLGHAHQMMVIHRDLKPANILISFEGEPILIDFNMAIDSNLAEITNDGGTLAYMAPEQLEGYLDGCRIATESSDIFALGLTFLEFLSGRLPFSQHRGRLGDILPQMIAERRAVSSRLHEIDALHGSEPIQSVLKRCLSPHPLNRYKKCEDIAADFESIIARELKDH